MAKQGTESASKQSGFTLIELMIVVVIVGLLAAISIPNYFSMLENSKRASCFTNQRHIIEATTLYVAETGTANGVISVTVLQVGNFISPHQYISGNPSECPASGNGDNDDYTITIANQVVTVMRCDIEPVKHLWDKF